jgi:hypothetical protein
LTMSFCCSVGCSSTGDAGFALATQTNLLHSFSQVAIVSARATEGPLNRGFPEWSASGTISLDYYCTAILDSLNFTSCFASTYGSAVHLALEPAEWSASFLTLFNGTGGTGEPDAIDLLDSTDFAHLSYSNFYGNRIHTLIYSRQNGINVDSSLFSGNDCTHEICVGQRWYLGTLTNCVFSGSFPSTNAIVIAGSRNFANSITASWFIACVNTELCPGNTIHQETVPADGLSPSLSNVFQPSPGFEESQQISDSRIFSESKGNLNSNADNPSSAVSTSQTL